MTPLHILTIRLPSWLQARFMTVPPSLTLPGFQAIRSFLPSASQTVTEPSCPAANREPSGDHARQSTPRSRDADQRTLPVATSKTRTTPVAQVPPPRATDFRSGEKLEQPYPPGS